MKRYRGFRWPNTGEVLVLAAVTAVLTATLCTEAASDKAVEREPMELIIVESEVTADIIEEPEEHIVEVNETVYIYDVPLDADLQLHIIALCEEYHIDPSVIIAVIERESNFRAGVKGDNGKSYGLMQIMERWHEERMEKLGVSDLLNPYQNVLVGIDYLAELCGRYEDIGMALMAYNAGPSGAKSNFWDKGIFENKYSSGVLNRSEELTDGMVEYVD